MILFGTLPDGSEVRSTTLGAHGLSFSAMTWGASLHDLRLAGVDHPLVLGFPTLEPYLTTEGRYFGAIVGRAANRIARGEVDIDGRTFGLDRNEAGRTTLHGGSDGTGQRNWKRVDLGREHISFADYLPDGHMGFPGAMLVRATYRILAGPALEISVLATATDSTICNFAQHSLFNFDNAATIADHRLYSPARHYLPVDDHLIPLGPPAPVQDTHLDFSEPTRLGDRLDGPVIDHNLCLHSEKLRYPRHVATLRTRAIQMRIESTEPGLQVYAGEHIHAQTSGIGGAPYGRHAGIALESQLWPDAPHHALYPSAILPFAQIYRQTTVLRFSRVRVG